MRLSDAQRLGLRIPAYGWQATILAKHSMAVLRAAGAEASQGQQERDVPHVSAHLWNALECQWRECKGSPRTAAARQPESHDRCVHAGCQSSEAGSPEQARPDGNETRGNGMIGHFDLNGPNWTMKISGRFRQVFWIVGVPDGIRTRVIAVKGRRQHVTY